MSARLLVTLLREPSRAVEVEDWAGVLTAARAESLLATLAHRLEGQEVPERVARLLDVARADAAHAQRQALWEAEMARRALAPLGIAPILLKGTAYVAAGLEAALGRSVGDLDILVPRERLAEVEAALLAAGWEWVKDDPYDQSYYRRWMHELPPLIHRERDRMIDVHHSILPLTHRAKPWPGDLLEQSRPLRDGLRILSPEHMVIHAAAHLIADGDLAGGLRNLWDIDRLCRDFAGENGEFFLSLAEEAWKHGLYAPTLRALRLSRSLYGTPLVASHSPILVQYHEQPGDRLFIRRMLARDGWGRATRPVLRFGFYLRSHWLRMPPAMLARHLWIKWRKPTPVSGAPGAGPQTA